MTPEPESRPDPFHVEPGGPALVTELAAGVELAKLSVGPMDNNAYLVTAGGESLLVDAAAEPERLLGLVAGRTVATVVTTHRHHDHVGALAAVAKELGAGAQETGAGTSGTWLRAGRDDAAAIEAATGCRQDPLDDGDELELGPLRLTVLTLVGHTPGSIALVLRPGRGPVHLFTGDSLFPGGPGKTAGPADFTRLLDDLERQVFARFDDDCVVHPGHGDATTLGAERPQLGEWRRRGW